MADMLDKNSRSRLMARVKSKNTGPEMALRRALHKRGIRYRLHNKKLAGTPDLFFPRFSAVVFVHGCFWHRHEGCRFSTSPKSRVDFWNEKFSGNMKRDARNIQELSGCGIRVGIVWTCSLRNDAISAASAGQVIDWLNSDSPNLVIGEMDVDFGISP